MKLKYNNKEFDIDYSTWILHWAFIRYGPGNDKYKEALTKYQENTKSKNDDR